MSLCIKDKCKRCDIGYVIKNYLKPLLQATTVQIQEYNMRLIDTKCLNTAVSFLYLFFGQKALQYTQYCDVHNVVERHKNNIDNSVNIAKRLQKDLLRKTSSRYIYYIMLTDGYFVKPDGSKAFFPGHVFILEKIPWGTDKTFYYIYQSYIDKYNFADFVDTYHTIKVGQKKVDYYLKKINDMVNKRIWDEEFRVFWKDLTKVDTQEMLNGTPQDAFFVCYRKIKSDSCLKNLLSFVKTTLKTIPNIESERHNIYGNKEDFDSDSHPYTNGQMLDSLTRLKDVLERSSNNVGPTK
jgi:hypothetical protein